jgi:aspartyl-tRNA(Asn)/glutamyl-tRNA(Gln) amidotransferase subunit C
MLDDHALSDLKRLCRIQSTPEEDAIFLRSLGRILDYIEQITQIDTAEIPPCNHPLRELPAQELREDEVSDLLSRDLFMANVPDHIAGMVRVPPVLREP